MAPPDVKAAIRYLRANAAQYNLDPTRFASMGDSSGGWVASMAALTGGVADLEGNLGTTGVSSDVQVGVNFFGPIDFLRMNSQRTGPGQMDHDDPNGPASALVGCAIQTCPDRVRLAIERGEALADIEAGWREEQEAFLTHRRAALLYD